MVEALIIIVALGGLEFILWSVDHKQQKKQIELLDSIWAELAIRNSVEEEREGAARLGAEKSQKH
jgi:hypothetical protein